MKKTIVDFFKNVKEYAKYLMKVDFKELFANTIILLCMLVIAAFAYIPVGILEDIIRTLIQITVSMSSTVNSVYAWIFKVFGACCSIYVFMWLFNKRYNYVNKDVTDPLKGNIVKNNGFKDQNEKGNSEKEEFELPKVKEKEEK